MASSGIQLNSSCLDAYQDLKLKKKYKYIVFNLNKNAKEVKSATEIVVEKTSTEKDYETFIADLPEGECRFAIYDFEFEKEGGGIRNKILFFSWSPDDALTGQKMVFASSKRTLTNALQGIASEIQGTDYSEIAYENVLEKVNRGA